MLLLATTRARARAREQAPSLVRRAGKKRSMHSSTPLQSPSAPSVLNTIESFREFRQDISGHSVGFVPTMGYLHDGHLSLIERAKLECDKVVASIFVNPSQFAEGEDLDTYPRSVESDLEKMRELGVDAVFLPEERTMYDPSGHSHYIDPQGFNESGEGAIRPTFFRGVTTVVAKLFNIVQVRMGRDGIASRRLCGG